MDWLKFWETVLLISYLIPEDADVSWSGMQFMFGKLGFAKKLTQMGI